MAVISFSRKFLFIKTRKTGGTSVQESLMPVLSGADIVTRQWDDIRSGERCVVEEFASLDDIHEHFPATLDGYYTFGFTRNPYEITLSRYFYEIKMGRIKGPATRRAFNRWARDVYFVGEPRFPGGRYLRDRSRHLLFDASLQPRVDTIGRLETLGDDFRAITERLELESLPLLHLNEARRGEDHRGWIDRRTRRAIEQNFDFELEYFGYTFEDRE
jgi:hypothetical protein